ncbi:MAG TPA: serine/threonine-protein kinase [Polyangiaceae bacterium]|nr:serine/threonine-protein kinase [Polyangiaceae bacterium]
MSTRTSALPDGPATLTSDIRRSVATEPAELISADPDSANPEDQLDLSIWDPREAVRAAANRELHTELVREAAARVGKISLFTTLALLFYWIATWLLTPSAVAGAAGLVDSARKVFVGCILLSLAMFAVTRLPRLKATHVTDLGYVYLFLLALLLSLLRHLGTSSVPDLIRQISPVCIPILAFGALIPAAPTRALAVAVSAALMDPLAMFMLHANHRYSARELPFVFASPLIAALVAQRISREVYRLNEGIAKAREVGSYKLVERLGTGGMAEVWRAHHRMLARPAAVKLIRPQVLIEHGPADSQRLLRLFTREVRATASLSSPHTIQVYDFGITREGAFYYVMELLTGLDLQSLVERYGPQPSERVAHLLSQACLSLREAHERSFVHRDIKPANMFTCVVGGEHDFVKVLDFGLVLDRHPTTEELEDEKRFVGTPTVMAPEMVRFQAPVDARADLYALGCVGYWLLTGKRVFDAETRHDMLVMHAHQKPIPPSRRVGSPVHPGLETLIMACLEKNPNRRPQSARELNDALNGLMFTHAWTEERAALWWRQHGLNALRAGAVPSSRSEPAPSGDDLEDTPNSNPLESVQKEAP